MKKYIWASVSVIMIGASIAFASCEKEKSNSISMANESSIANNSSITNTSMKYEPNDMVIIGHSDSEDGEIKQLFDKNKFLKAFEDSLNKSGGEYIVEELNLWNEEYKKGEFAPLMSISFYDLKQECGNTLFIQPSIIDQDGTLCYAVGGSSPHDRCFGECNNTCRAILDHKGKFYGCQPCTDPMPHFDLGDWQKRQEWLLHHHCSDMGRVVTIEPTFRMAINIFSKY